MTLEEQILRLEGQRERCLDELEDEIHTGMRHVRQRLSPARFLRRHIGSSIVTVGMAGILLPWLAGQAWPFSHPAARADQAGVDARGSTVAPAGTSETQIPSRGSAGRFLSAIVRTAAVEVASRVDIPGLLSRFVSKAEKSKHSDKNNG